jgi:hypothetical protein
MVIKNSSSATECLFSIGAKLGGLPESIVKECERFCKRNLLMEFGEKKGSKEFFGCCERCLKAHLIFTARSFGFGKEVLGKISKAFGCERGHDGYYLDGEKVVKL